MGKLSKHHNVTVFSEFPSYHKVRKNISNKYKKIKIFRFWTFPRRKNLFSIFLNYLTFIAYGTIKIFSLKKKKIALIFIYATSPIFQAIPGIIFGKIFKIPTFIWVQDLWPEVIEDLKIIKSSFLIYIIRKITDLIYIKSDFLLVQSNSFKRSINNRIKKKIDILYNPEVRSNYKYSENYKNKCTIIFAGNLGNAQNLKILILAVKKIRKSNIYFKIYGSGTQKENLSKQIKENNLSSKVKIYKPITQKKLKKQLNSSSGL